MQRNRGPMEISRGVILLSILLTIPVPCSSEGAVSIPKDVLFMIDGSGSVKPHNFDKLRVLLKNIVDRFEVGGPDGTNVALIQFSSRKLTKVEFNLDSFNSKEAIKEAIDNMVYQRKYTYTGYAMKLAREQVFNGRGGDRPNAKNVLLLFTDGEAADPHIARAESKAMKSAGAHVMSVGFGPKRSVDRFKDELEAVASNKDKDVFLRGFQDLDNIERRMLEAVEPKTDCFSAPCKNGGTCETALDTFRCVCTEDYEGVTCERKKGACHKKPCLNDGVCQEVGDDFKCICGDNFQGRTCEKERVVCTTKNADILFIMDGSRSIKNSDFVKMKKFVTKMVYRFNISKDESHVAVIQFSDSNRAVVEFNLHAYYNKDNIMSRIDRLVIQDGSATYTDAAFKKAREQVFTGRGGDRKDIRNVIILLTDGQAHDNKAAIREATKLKDVDVSIISIGVGRGEINKEFYGFLEKLASNSNFVFKVSFSELETILDGVTRAACENLRDA